MFEAIRNSEITAYNLDAYPQNIFKKNLFFKVSETDIYTLQNIIQTPLSLRCFWQELGYGFFKINADGNKSTEEVNRLMDPLSIADILAGESEQVSPDFVLEPYQVPFFERFSEYFVCFDSRDSDKPKQPVYWMWDMKNPLAESIESFIYKLFENPDFLNEI